jgi:DNA-binding XRE family transcriptional regulator
MKGGENLKKRIALKQLRIGLQLTQQEMADKLSVSRSTYIAIENGMRDGAIEFWKALKETFDVPNEKMWELME